MSPPLLLVLCAVAFVFFVRVARWPFPLALAAAAIVAGVVGTLEFPFRHLVEGTFGYFNLILALFAGAWFGQVVRQSGLASGFAAGLLRVTGLRPAINLGVIAALLFAAGMFTGLAGVAVLTVGVFAAPVPRRRRPHRARRGRSGAAPARQTRPP